jgi:hypothetical protein
LLRLFGTAESPTLVQAPTYHPGEYVDCAFHLGAYLQSVTAMMLVDVKRQNSLTRIALARQLGDQLSTPAPFVESDGFVDALAICWNLQFAFGVNNSKRPSPSCRGQRR